MSLARTYDAINTAIFLSAGGSHRVRRCFVEALDIRAGHRVLEIGCGTVRSPSAGLHVDGRRQIAGGRAQILVLPSHSHSDR